MKAELQFQKGSTPVPSFTPARNSLLQCTCRGTPGLDVNGIVCGGKNLTVERSLANQARTSIAPPIVHDVLPSPGQPLDQATRTFMEPRFGHDFSKVRVHTDARAAESAHAVNALAYTVGHNIVFGGGQYTPNTTAGRRLLAHELTHTVQQESNQTTLQSRLEVGAADDAFEREADTVAIQVLDALPSARGVSHSIRPATRGLVQPGRLQRTIGDGHDLQSPRFAGDPVLEACFDNEDLLRVGRRGEAVKKIQQALIDAAALDGAENPLPKFGVDGIFEHETETAVKKYQRKHRLDPDGIVGPHTMGSLDALFAPPVPVPPKPGPTPPKPKPPAPKPPTPKKPVAVVMTGSTELWHFDGATPPNYPVQQLLTASAGGITGTFHWSIVKGGAFADFSGSPTAIGPGVTLKSKSPSSALNDIQIKVDFTGVGGETGTTTNNSTVRAPQSMTPTGNVNSAIPRGWQSLIGYSIQDQFGTTLPRNVEVNEKWDDKPAIPDFPGTNWPSLPPSTPSGEGHAPVNPAGWPDNMNISDGIPPVRIPPSTAPGTGGPLVMHFRGHWQVGSPTKGGGRRVRAVTWRFFQDHGDHL